MINKRFPVCLLAVLGLFLFGSVASAQRTPGNSMSNSYGRPSGVQQHSPFGIQPDPSTEADHLPLVATVPGVLGLPYPTARRMLEDSGFQVQSRGLNSNPDLEIVGGQSPTAYAAAPRGSAVMLTLH